jgi:hypothetical protein
MSHSTLRDTTIILLGYENYTVWERQLKTRANALGIWEVVNPLSSKHQLKEPALPSPPDIAEFETTPKHQQDNRRANPNDPAGTVYEATQLTQLLANGATDYKNALENYKTSMDIFRILDHRYREEKQGLEKLVVFLQGSISQFLQTTCLDPDKTVKEWITTLEQTAGVDKEDERQKARARYQQALRPMRVATVWETWLAEYDQSATIAETYNVAEVMHFKDILNDFLSAIVKIEPMWASILQDSARQIIGMTRKEMIKRFREHMALQHPSKGKQKGGAFSAAAPSPAGGESDQVDDRDASRSMKTPAPSGGGNPRGRPRQKRSFGSYVGQVPQPSNSKLKDPTAVGKGQLCPACDLRHNLQDCWYAFPLEAPEYFEPREAQQMLCAKRVKSPGVKAQIERAEEGRKTKKAKSQSYHVIEEEAEFAN